MVENDQQLNNFFHNVALDFPVMFLDYKGTWFAHKLNQYVSLDFPFAELYIHKDYKDTWISHELIQCKSSEITDYMDT